MASGGVSTLVCQRQEPQPDASKVLSSCTLANSSLVSFNPKEMALADLDKAELDRQSRAYHIAYQVVLHTQSGTIPLTSASPSDRNIKVTMVEEINHFLQHSERQQLMLQLEDSRHSQVFGFLLIVTGISSRLFARQIVRCLGAIRNETG